MLGLLQTTRLCNVHTPERVTCCSLSVCLVRFLRRRNITDNAIYVHFVELTTPDVCRACASTHFSATN